MAKSLIVYGPQGCGKTRNAQKIARLYGLHTVVEADEPGAPDRVNGDCRHGHLFITCDLATSAAVAAMSGANVLHYDTLASSVEDRRNSGQQGKTSADNLRGIVAGLEAVAAQCNRGMATMADADFLTDQVAKQPWLTAQSVDLLHLHAKRITHNGGSKTDQRVLIEIANIAQKAGA